MKIKLYENELHISDQQIRKMIDDCLRITKHLYSDIDFNQVKFDTTTDNHELGAYNIIENKIYLNKNIFKDSAENVKSTILHELAHFIDAEMCIKAGLVYRDGNKVMQKDNAGKILEHNKQWQDIAHKISAYAKVPIEQTGTSIGITANKNHLYRYNLECTICHTVREFAEKDPLTPETIKQFQAPETTVYCDKCKKYTRMKFINLN